MKEFMEMMMLTSMHAKDLCTEKIPLYKENGKTHYSEREFLFLAKDESIDRVTLLCEDGTINSLDKRGGDISIFSLGSPTDVDFPFDHNFIKNVKAIAESVIAKAT